MSEFGDAPREWKEYEPDGQAENVERSAGFDDGAGPTYSREFVDAPFAHDLERDDASFGTLPNITDRVELSPVHAGGEAMRADADLDLGLMPSNEARNMVTDAQLDESSLPKHTTTRASRREGADGEELDPGHVRESGEADEDLDQDSGGAALQHDQPLRDLSRPNISWCSSSRI
jgi:hypothetical protein